MTREFDQAYWEERYRGAHDGRVRRPSPQLLTETAGLEAGKALDAGCGEGANAAWLASQGWYVTAVDISDTALERARAYAESLGREVAERITWSQVDLTDWSPPLGHFDLVTAHYVHPASSYDGLLRVLADAVVPGGTLLIVDHAPSAQPEHPGHAGHSRYPGHAGHPPHQGHPAHPGHEVHCSHGSAPHVHRITQEVAAGLDPQRWDIVVAETRKTETTDPHGREVVLDDTVLRALKRL